jgi:hypothetical protein
VPFVAAVVGVSAFLQVAAVQPALGDASGRASCVGIEASSISPPGSSGEFRGGMPQLVATVKEGGKLGPAISAFAKEHAGSHELCDVGG